jgi:hypothetical protein
VLAKALPIKLAYFRVNFRVPSLVSLQVSNGWSSKQQHLGSAMQRIKALSRKGLRGRRRCTPLATHLFNVSGLRFGVLRSRFAFVTLTAGCVAVQAVESLRAAAAKRLFAAMGVAGVFRQVAFEITAAMAASGAFDIAFQLPQLPFFLVHRTHL